jgi:alkaline phosphatase
LIHFLSARMMCLRSSLLLAGLFLLNLSACRATSVPSSKPESKRPKNIVLMIGDGMGISQITAGMYSNNNWLNLERIRHIGLVKTTSSDDLITDSAAGATAIATGTKTYNGAIGVGPDSLPRPTILEIAEAGGMATGMVATSEIVHATPACFVAHQYNRRMYEEIAADMLKIEIDLFIGGGLDYFLRRRDQRDLVSELRERNYRILNSHTPFEDVRIVPGQNLAYFTATDRPDRKAKGRDYLPEAVAFATDFLHERSKKGFFLMIEGSQIDWGGHANNADYVISEMLDFDAAIGRVLDFADESGETLVIVTADHETGGLGINRGSEMGELKTAFTSGGHTGAMVPIFAYGPGAEAFTGIMDNVEIFHRMIAVLGLKKAYENQQKNP